MKVATFTGPEGIACIVVPANPGADMNAIAAQAIANRGLSGATPFEVIEHTDVPQDRTFRNAWVPGAGRVEVDMEKARNVCREKVREARVAAMAKLDVESLKAIEADNRAEQMRVAAEKQLLRDAPADPAIDAAKTPEDLLALRPAGLDWR